MKEKRRAPGSVKVPLLADIALAAIITALFFALGVAGAVSRKAEALSVGLFRGGGAVYRGRDGACAALVITADWDAAALGSILDTLDAHDAKATFAIGRLLAEENAPTVARIAERGHELAVIGGGESYGDYVSELRETLRLIELAAGVRPRLLFAAENGVSENRAARELGLTCVVGSVDLMTLRGTAGDIIARAEGNTGARDIVVSAPTEAFSRALSYILDHFAAMGLTVTAVSGTIYD